MTRYDVMGYALLKYDNLCFCSLSLYLHHSLSLFLSLCASMNRCIAQYIVRDYNQSAQQMMAEGIHDVAMTADMLR